MWVSWFVRTVLLPVVLRRRFSTGAFWNDTGHMTAFLLLKMTSVTSWPTIKYIQHRCSCGAGTLPLLWLKGVRTWRQWTSLGLPSSSWTVAGLGHCGNCHSSQTSFPFSVFASTCKALWHAGRAPSSCFEPLYCPWRCTKPSWGHSYSTSAPGAPSLFESTVMGAAGWGQNRPTGASGTSTWTSSSWNITCTKQKYSFFWSNFCRKNNRPRPRLGKKKFSKTEQENRLFS